MVQCPSSRFAKNGPPGCARKTSNWPFRIRNISNPELTRDRICGFYKAGWRNQADSVESEKKCSSSSFSRCQPIATSWLNQPLRATNPPFRHEAGESEHKYQRLVPERSRPVFRDWNLFVWEPTGEFV